MARLSGLQSAAATRTENAGGSANGVIQLFWKIEKMKENLQFDFGSRYTGDVCDWFLGGVGHNIIQIYAILISCTYPKCIIALFISIFR